MAKSDKNRHEKHVPPPAPFVTQIKPSKGGDDGSHDQKRGGGSRETIREGSPEENAKHYGGKGAC